MYADHHMQANDEVERQNRSLLKVLKMVHMGSKA